jgi:signal transduction histidine kinase
MRAEQSTPTESLDTKLLLNTLVAVKKGDFSVRLPGDWSGTNGKIADTLNDIIEMNRKMALDVDGRPLKGEFLRTAKTVNTMVDQLNGFASEVTRVAREVGVEGKLGGQATVSGVSGALAEMRTLLVELRPAALTEAPFENLLQHLTEAFRGRTRVPLALAVEGQRPLPPDVQIALYRIAQEALNNVARHAAATQVTVGLHFAPEQVKLRIADNGRGFDLDKAPTDHLGLKIMRERAAAVGAHLTLQSEIGAGTEIVVLWAERQEAQPEGEAVSAAAA